jgi:hypothetical protein
MMKDSINSHQFETVMSEASSNVRGGQIMKRLITPLAILALFTAGATVAQADPWNKLTRLTIK